MSNIVVNALVKTQITSSKIDKCVTFDQIVATSSCCCNYETPTPKLTLCTEGEPMRGRALSSHHPDKIYTISNDAPLVPTLNDMEDMGSVLDCQLPNQPRKKWVLPMKKSTSKDCLFFMLEEGPLLYSNSPCTPKSTLSSQFDAIKSIAKNDVSDTQKLLTKVCSSRCMLPSKAMETKAQFLADKPTDKDMLVITSHVSTKKRKPLPIFSKVALDSDPNTEQAPKLRLKMRRQTLKTFSSTSSLVSFFFPCEEQ